MNALAAIVGVVPAAVLRACWELFSLIPGAFGIVLRYAVLKKCAARCGDNVYIGRFVVIKNMGRLTLGSNVSIHDTCYLDALGQIRIGSNVSIAHQTSIVSFDHTWDDQTTPIKYNPLVELPIVIEDDVWIGCGVRLLAGAHLGTRSIAAAGCVVNSAFGPGEMVGGVPARIIRSIRASAPAD